MGATLETVCEAATAVGDGVVCGVLKVDHELRDHILTGNALDPFVSIHTDPSTVLNFCCGTALPVEPTVTALDRLLHDIPDDPEDGATRHAHYTNCPVWQLHVERDRFEGADGLGLDGIEPVGHTRALMADTFGTVDWKQAQIEGERMERDPEYRPAAGQQVVTQSDLAGWDVDG